MSSLSRKWTHLSPSSASIPNTTNPALHPYQNPTDTRTSSTASLLPAPAALEDVQSGRSSARTLLCVFIHGFVGDETSFRSFPAHFHELLTILVQDTHIVHTKVYPKFKTRDKISLAVDNFSRWLSNFESPTTDIILLGHSMGGLLAADICLLPPFPPGRHRILGHISFDTPFIGIHPGVITSGLASLFKPAEKPPPDPEIPTPAFSSRQSIEMPASDTASVYSTSTLSTLSSTGSANSLPHYTPPVIKPKKTAWQSGMNFLRKHQGGLKKAAVAYVNGHLEFSGALLDIKTMKTRYDRIKALEKPDIDDRRKLLLGGSKGWDDTDGTYVPRVRFVNYYTVSTGRVKREKSRSRTREDEIKGEAMERAISSTSGSGSGTPSSPTGTPAILANGEIIVDGPVEMPISPLPSPLPPTIDIDPNTELPPPPYIPSASISPTLVDDKKNETDTSITSIPPSPNPPVKEERRKREKTFCIIPRDPDPCWVKVKVENVDEVGAHCGLFFVNGVPGVETPGSTPISPSGHSIDSGVSGVSGFSEGVGMLDGPEDVKKSLSSNSDLWNLTNLLENLRHGFDSLITSEI
ncbi:hypothetical protein ABW19_dt0205953 [Dactylella cylindrospora]|nr:hypothetical protein ABW19_dt0205953 [Dactylella cylindrospora]